MPSLFTVRVSHTFPIPLNVHWILILWLSLSIVTVILGLLISLIATGLVGVGVVLWVVLPYIFNPTILLLLLSLIVVLPALSVVTLIERSLIFLFFSANSFLRFSILVEFVEILLFVESLKMLKSVILTLLFFRFSISLISVEILEFT